MKNIFRIFRADVKRLSTNVVAVVIIMGLSVIPSLYAWFNILSNWDPYGAESTSNLKIAVYSNDEGTDLENISINIGSNVVKGLQENKSIGWVFSDSEDEAINGVYSGEYYAALIIPENFTADMISFLGGNIEHPQITYYENDKKNAIAPKITAKAKTAVQEEVNSSFVSTLAETITQISNSVAGTEENGSSILDVVISQLTELDQDMQSYITILDSFINVTNSASSLIATTQVVVPDLNSMVDSGQNTVNAMQGAVSSGTGSAETVTDMVSYSLSLISSNLDSVSSLLQSNLATLEGYEGAANTTLSNAQTVMPYLQELFKNSVASWQDQAVANDQVTAIEAQLKQIETDINAVSANVSDSTAAVKALENQIINEINTCNTQIKNLQNTFTYSVKPQLSSTMTTMQNSLLSVQAILNGVDGDFSDVSEVLDEYADTISKGNASLTDSRDMAKQLKDGFDTIISQLSDLGQNEQYKEVTDILKSDPELLGQFISSPVNLDTKVVYPIENYGSAMAPFYTILAIWVGALILVAVIHVKVHPEQGITNVKPYQKYFGRYIPFFTTGQAQTLIMVLGNIFYLKIQCHNPFLFWVAAALSSLVFTLLIYSLTVAFGNIGEAIAVVIMVIQVAGAGGTFPIEVLPKVYQYIYKYLPFPYGMNAMRETIGGMYGMEYIKCLGVLGIYILISLFIGLVVAVPFEKLNKKIEKSKEQTDLMI